MIFINRGLPRWVKSPNLDGLGNLELITLKTNIFADDILHSNPFYGDPSGPSHIVNKIPMLTAIP